LGLDHGVGHPLLLLCHAKAPNYLKKKGFKDLLDYPKWPKVADAVIETDFSASIMALATPFCFCTTQKYLTVKRARRPRA
jgi:hypothetical protein